jgi:hypothetical protein
MKTNRLVRLGGYIALVVLALGAIGYVANGGGDGSSDGLATVFPEEAANDGRAVLGMPDSAESLARQTEGVNGALPSKGAPPADSDARASNSSAGGVGQPGAGPDANGLVLSQERKIVQTASMQLQVEEVGGAFEEVGRIAAAAGGFVASSSFSYKGDVQVAAVSIRVPAARYQGVLAELRDLGVKVDAENSNASDVTEEYTDLAARLRNLEATEQQLLTLLNRAETIADILTVQDRLNNVRGEIEQVKGRMQLLDNLTDLATITVHLRPAVGTGSNGGGNGVNLGKEISEAWDESLDFLGGIVAGVLTVIVFGWWVPVVGVPLLLVIRLLNSNAPRSITSVD